MIHNRVFIYKRIVSLGSSFSTNPVFLWGLNLLSVSDAKVLRLWIIYPQVENTRDAIGLNNVTYMRPGTWAQAHTARSRLLRHKPSVFAFWKSKSIF